MIDYSGMPRQSKLALEQRPAAADPAPIRESYPRLPNPYLRHTGPHMHIHKVSVRNFRLLADAELALETPTTLIVGRNNSGKTSLSEAIRRFLVDQNPKFRIEDFSNTSYDGFCDALAARNAGRPDDEVRTLIPRIELRLQFRYDPVQPDLGALSDFIVDLDPDCNEALVVARYELRDGAIESLFAEQPAGNLTDRERIAFFQELRERVPDLFTANIWAEDPNDDTNRKQMSVTALRSLLKTGFVNAQRGLDDDTSRDTDVLAKILEGLFTAAKSPTAGEDEQLVAQALQEAVREIQNTIRGDFREELKKLMPDVAEIRLSRVSNGSELETETTLDVERLLSRHTKVRYAGHHGILLPESYTGLGIRNLIFILLRIVSFYRTFRAEPAAPGVHLVFIEEPEAHLHPQMQEVVYPPSLKNCPPAQRTGRRAAAVAGAVHRVDPFLPRRQCGRVRGNPLFRSHLRRRRTLHQGQRSAPRAARYVGGAQAVSPPVPHPDSLRPLLRRQGGADRRHERAPVAARDHRQAGRGRARPAQALQPVRHDHGSRRRLCAYLLRTSRLPGTAHPHHHRPRLRRRRPQLSARCIGAPRRATPA